MSAPEPEDDVCPHCGAVLDLARALGEGRSVVRRRGAGARVPTGVIPDDEDAEA